MSRLSFGSWVTANAGVLSVLGALVIFFSWVVTNTLGQRYTRLKQSVETAESTFRLYTTLHELRASLNSVAMETVYAREAAERANSDESEKDPQLLEIERLRNDYSHTRLSAHQIIELMDFASQTFNFSADAGTDTETAKRVRALHGDIYEVYRQVRDRNRAAEESNSSPRPNVEQLRPAIEEYVRFVRKDAIPRVGPLYEAIVEASNDRREEGRRQLARLKRNTMWATRVALVLYVIGSLLALGGQYLDKVHKKKMEATTPAGAETQH